VHSSRPSVEGVMATVDAFDAALRARDLIAAEAVWTLDRPDVSILGSASGEVFIGPDAVRTCLAALTSRQTAHGWRWVDRQVSVVGDVAWVTAEAPWQTVHPDGTVTERPYRVTGVLVRVDGAWRWCQYHGSEPLGSTG
jgi:ketosteroid isomerase-like protein